MKLLVFDYRDIEKEFFDNNTFENFNITFFKESLNNETVKKIPEELKDSTTMISVFVDSEVTRNVINQFKNLRLISTRSTGYDHIDMKMAQKRNLAVINVENYGSTSVAQFTVGLMIALIRKIIPAYKYVQKQRNSAVNFLGRDLTHLTIGIVGTGSIGAAVCNITDKIGMKVLAYDLHEKTELIEKCNIKYVDLETLVKESDVISLHLPYTGENKYMFAEKEFALMKESSYFINTSRGELVQLHDLYEALISKKISGAALDVVACEEYCFRCKKESAKISEVSFECIEEAETLKKLVKLDSVIVTPHIAYETQDAVNFILQKTFEGIADCIKGGHQYRLI